MKPFQQTELLRATDFSMERNSSKKKIIYFNRKKSHGKKSLISPKQFANKYIGENY